jgi:hypothetical protein
MYCTNMNNKKAFQVFSWRFTLQNLLRMVCRKRASKHTSFMNLCKRPEKVLSAFCYLHYWKLYCNNVIRFPQSFFTPQKFLKNIPPKNCFRDLISLWFFCIKYSHRIGYSYGLISLWYFRWTEHSQDSNLRCSFSLRAHIQKDLISDLMYKNRRSERRD